MTQAELFLLKFNDLPLDTRLHPDGDQAVNYVTLIDTLNECDLYYQISNIDDTSPSIHFFDLSVATIEVLENEDTDVDDEWLIDAYAGK